MFARGACTEPAAVDRYAEREGMELENCFQALMTGLAVRYFKAVAGQQPG